MGQAVHRLVQEGVIVKGQDEDGAWLLQVHGLPLRAFGDKLAEAVSDASGVQCSDLFVEIDEAAGSAACSAVSEVNAMWADRERPPLKALAILQGLLHGSGEDCRGVVRQDEVKHDDDSDGDFQVSQVQEAAIRPTSGCEDDLEAAMWHLVSVFIKDCVACGMRFTENDVGTAALLLRHHGWDNAAAVRQLQNNASVLSEAGFQGAQEGSFSAIPGTWRCGICFDDFDSSANGLSLNCRHTFCRDCWSQYLAVVARGGAGGDANLLDTNCPDPSCSHRVGLAVYERLDLSDLAEMWRRALFRSFLQDGDAVVECPGCSLKLPLGASKPEAGPCRHCGRRFCSLCFDEPHGPLTCAEYRTWRGLLKDPQQGLFAKWSSRIMAFLAIEDEVQARRCPNPQCGVMSQKVDGCLFLICPRCREYWCWNCGNWGGGQSGRPRPHHVFYCSDVPSDMTWLDGDSSLQGTSRFEFHHTLWETRDADLATAKGSLPAFKLPQDSSDEVDEFDELHAVRCDARRVLRNAAAWRFFEENDDRRRLFEFAEADLENLLDPSQSSNGSCGSRSFFDGGSVTQRRQRQQALVSALRSQMHALHSYLRISGT